MNEFSIAVQTVNSEARVDSRVMAERLDNKHKSVMELIGKNEAYFEGFGHLPFETETVQNSVGAVNKARFALLNEDQCFFLLTLVRNSKRVVLLKAALVMAFRKVREVVAARPVLDMTDPLAVARAFVTAESERRVLALTVQEQKPKVDAFDTFMDSETLLSIQSVSQLLNIGEITLFRILREEHIFMTREVAGRDLHNTPYRMYTERGLFEVKTRTVELPSGREIQQFTTYATPKGTEFIRNLLGKKPQARQNLLLSATA